MNKEKIHIQYAARKTTTENWTYAETMIQKALLHVYPIITQNNNIQILGRNDMNWPPMRKKKDTHNSKKKETKYRKLYIDAASNS